MAVQGPGSRSGTGARPVPPALPAQRSPADGRVARGDRTRSALIEATVALIRSGRSLPTAGQVAEQAGVSVRLVFHHFGAVQALYDCAVALESARARALIGIVPPRGPVAVRISAICRQRRQLFEDLAHDPWASLSSQSSTGPRSGPQEDLHGLLRRQLVVGLRPEILAAGGDAPVLFEALDAAAGWRNWASLRLDGRRSATDAERVVVYALTVLLRGATGPSPAPS